MQSLQLDVEKKVDVKASTGIGSSITVVDAKTIFARAMDRLKTERGINVKNVFELEARLKKDKSLKKDFMKIIEDEIQKSGAKMSPSAVFETGLREKKLEEYRQGIAVKLLGVEKEHEKSIAKLLAVFDSVAAQSGEKDVFKFYYKYNTNPAFRERANAILIKELSSDPELKTILEREKPEAIMHDLARLKASFMSKTDYIKFVVKESLKRAPLEFAKHGAEVAGGTIAALMLAPMHAVMNAVPGLGSAAKMSMQTLSEVSDVFKKIPQAVGSIGASQTSPIEQARMLQYDLLRKAGEEASKIYKVS